MQFPLRPVDTWISTKQPPQLLFAQLSRILTAVPLSSAAWVASSSGYVCAIAQGDKSLGPSIIVYDAASGICLHKGTSSTAVPNSACQSGIPSGNHGNFTSVGTVGGILGISRVMPAVSPSGRNVTIGVHLGSDLIDNSLSSFGLLPSTLIRVSSLSLDLASCNTATGSSNDVFSEDSFSAINAKVTATIPSPLACVPWTTIVALSLTSCLVVALAFIWLLTSPAAPTASSRFSSDVNLFASRSLNFDLHGTPPGTPTEKQPVGSGWQFRSTAIALVSFALTTAACLSIAFVVHIGSNLCLDEIADATLSQMGFVISERIRLMREPPAIATASIALLARSAQSSLSVDTMYRWTSFALTALAIRSSNIHLASAVTMTDRFGSNVIGTVFSAVNDSATEPVTIQRDLNPSAQDWFRSSTLDTGHWTSPRTLVSGELVFTRSQTISQNSTIVCIDFDSSTAQTLLQILTPPSWGTMQIERGRTGTVLVRDPTGDAFEQQGPPVQGQIQSVSVDRIVVANYDTLAVRVTLPDASVDDSAWMAVATASARSTLGDYKRVELMAWIIVIGIVVIIGFIAMSSLSTWEKRMMPRDTTMSGLGKEKLSPAALEEHKARIKKQIVAASAQSWRRKRASRRDTQEENDQPLDYDEIQAHVSERAVGHIRDSLHDRNILTVCELEAREGGEVDIAMYLIFSNSISRLLLYAAIAVHIGLQLVEPATQKALANWGPSPFVVAIEGVCLAIESAYMVTQFRFKYFAKAMDNCLVETAIAADIALCVVLILCAVDWMLSATISFSFEYAFPLRPFIPFLFSRDLRTALLLFGRAIVQAADTLILWLSTLFMFAIAGVVMFRDSINVGQYVSSFANIRDSFTTIFVFASTEDNYGDVVYPAFDLHCKSRYRIGNDI